MAAATAPTEAQPPTVPKTVTMRGEEVFEVVAKMDALASYLYNTMAGRTTTGPGEDALEMAWELFRLAFGDGPLEENPLSALVDERSADIYSAWIRRIPRRGEAG